MPFPKPCAPMFREISPEFLYKPTQVPRRTTKIKIKTKKMKIKTTSCNPTVPGSVAVRPREFLGKTPPHQQIINRIETTVPHLLPANTLAGGFFSYSCLTQRSGQTRSSQIHLINHLFTTPRSKRQICVSQAPADWTNVPLANYPARKSMARVTCL